MANGKIRVDEIRNKAGTGAPQFPNGVRATNLTDLAGTGAPLINGASPIIRWQTKSLDTDVTTAPLDVSSLQFNNLEIGKTYRITAELFAGQNTTTNSVIDMRWYSAAGATGTWYSNFRVGRTGPSWTAPSGDSRYTHSFIFVATSTTLFTRLTDINGMFLYAEASGRGTKITIEELPLHEQVTIWT